VSFIAIEQLEERSRHTLLTSWNSEELLVKVRTRLRRPPAGNCRRSPGDVVMQGVSANRCVGLYTPDLHDSKHFPDSD